MEGLGSIRCKRCRRHCKRTGRRQLYCQVCRVAVERAQIAEHERRRILARGGKPGVGSGNGQARGENNPAYKNGTGIFRRHRKAACERCGSKRFLCVHHKDEDRMNNDLSNLETLCKRCHQIHHGCREHWGAYAGAFANAKRAANA